MDPSPYAGSGAGAGGKIRRRPPARAAATPYDRPPAAVAAHRLAAAAAAASSGPSGEGTGGGGWVSRLVDPASRLLAGGAARLFSSLFRNRKRLDSAPAQAPPSSSPTGRNTEAKQDGPESTYVNSGPVLDIGMGKGKKPAGVLDDDALSEVEHLLMRKKFTRVESDRLTDLLRARTIESDLPTSMDSHEEKNVGSARTNEPGGSSSHGVAADYHPTAKVHSYGANSPAELAKQYMSSRYSREPLPRSLRSRLFLDNKGEVSNIAYDKRSGQQVQERIEFQNDNPGLPVNGYTTPGLHGRSALYRMSRSPYFKAPSSSINVNMSSLSQRAPSLNVGGSQVLKRRAADLDNEHGSIGPIRRIRQKSNMLSSFRDACTNPRESRTSGSGFTEDSVSIQESQSSKRLLLGSGQSVQPLESHKDGRDVKSSDTIPPIPAQSNKMAEKIFEQLNIIAPSPKEKQSGKQSVHTNSSSSMSKEPILQDNGPNNMGDLSSSLKFHDLDGANGPLDQDMNGSRKGKLKLTIGGSSKVSSPDKATTLGNSVSAATSRKPGFKMAVLEDLTELDDDLEAPKGSPSKIHVGTTEQKIESSNRKEQKIDQNILEQKVGANLASVSKTILSGLFSSNDPGKTDTVGATAENNTGFTFPHVPPGTKTGSTASALPVGSVQDNKQSGASTSIFGLKQSSTSDLKTSTVADVKNKAGLMQSVTKPTALESTSSEKGDKRERAEGAIQSSDKVFSSTASTLNAPLHFAATSSSLPSLSNGFSYSSSPKLTSADKPALGSAPSTSVFTVASSSPVVSSATPSPAFSFGSGTSVGSSIAASVKSEISEAKAATTLAFGIGGTAAEAKSTAPESTINSPISSISSPFSSSTTSSSSIFSSVSTFSSSPAAASSVAAGSATTAAPSSTSTAPGVQSASTASVTPSSSGGNFGFSSSAQSTGLGTSVAPSTSQPPVASAVFGSKLPQSESTVSQPPQSPAQFGSSFPSTGVGASSSGSGAVSFGVGASSPGSGTSSFGVGTSSSTPGTVTFGAAASSSGSGMFSFGAGIPSSGSGTVSFGLGAGAASSGPAAVSFGAGTASSGPGAASFGAAAMSSGPGTVSLGVGAASSGPGTASFSSGTASTGPGTVSFGVGAASSGPGTVSFGVGAASSGPGTVSFGVGAASSGSGTFTFGAGATPSGSGTPSFGAGASSSEPSTVSFGATTSAAGSVFGNSQFGAGSTFSNPFSSSSGTGFAFSPTSSSAVSSTVASSSVFSNSSAASSTSSFSNPFSSSSAPPSQFAFGQSASSGGGFAFGAQSAPAFSSQPAFSFNTSSTSMNSSTPPPAFGMTNTNTGFGMGSTGNGNDQMNEDSMADDTNQAAPTPAPIFGSSPFGQQSNSLAAPVFGAPSVQPGGVFQFGGQQQGSAPQNPAFPPAGSLEFQGGGFSLGSGGAGGDKSNRRVIKVRRAQKKR